MADRRGGRRGYRGSGAGSLRTATTIGALVLVGVLAGCGEDDPFQTYCDEVDAQQAELTEILADQRPSGLIEALPHFEALAEKAPSDIRDDWSTVIGGIEGLAVALEDAGVEPEDYDRANPPGHVTDEQRKAIDRASKRLSRPETVEALESVQQQARDVCKQPLSLS